MPFLGFGLLYMLVSLFFAVHAIRTGRQMYWLFILFAFPLLGSVVYFFAEYLPTTRIEHSVMRAGAQIARSLDPGRELRDAGKAYEIAPTAQNQMRMAHALLEAGKADDASNFYAQCLAGPFGAEPDVRAGAARAELTRGNLDPAVELLAKIRRDSPQYRPEVVGVLLAQAYWAQGNLTAAARTFAEASRIAGSVDARAEYAIFALQTGDVETARSLQRDIDISRKTWSRHNKQYHREVLSRLGDAWSKSGYTKA